MAEGAAQREKNRGIVRGLHLEAIEAAGAARAAALQEADEHLQRVGSLLPDALDAGLSLSEISRVTGVSRPTLYELRGRYDASDRDLSLVVLQSVALAGALPVSDLAGRLDRPAGEILRRAQSFEAQGFMEIEPEDGPEGTFPVMCIVPEGLDLLEAWFEQREEEGEEP